MKRTLAFVFNQLRMPHLLQQVGRAAHDGGFRLHDQRIYNESSPSLWDQHTGNDLS